MKTAVIGEGAAGVVTYNESLVALLAHYGSTPRTCQPYRAKTKGKVERPFRYVRQDFFLGSSFHDMDELNAQFEAWRTTISNLRVHSTTQWTVDEHFAEEQLQLMALPARPYDAVSTVERRISQEVMVAALRKQDIPADVEGMDADLRTLLDTQVSDFEQRIESIAQEETSAAKASLLRSIPGICPVSAAMLIAEMPELGRMTSGEAAAMTGLAPVPHDSGAMRGRRAIAGGRRSRRHVLFQAALAACHNPVLKPVAQHLKIRGKPNKLVIVAIARRLVTIANAILKTGVPWRQNPVA